MVAMMLSSPAANAKLTRECSCPTCRQLITSPIRHKLFCVRKSRQLAAFVITA